jgi:hypothetical protein
LGILGPLGPLGPLGLSLRRHADPP